MNDLIVDLNNFKIIQLINEDQFAKDYLIEDKITQKKYDAKVIKPTNDQHINENTII